LLDQSEENDLIMIAELHRYLGGFDSFLIILNDLPDKHFRGLKYMFTEECEKRTKRFFYPKALGELALTQSHRK